MLKSILLATVASLALSGAAAAQDADADTVIATVNGTEITLGQLIIARAQLPQQYQQLPADILFDGLVEQLIQQELLANSVTEEPKRVAMALQLERRSLLAGEAIEVISNEAITDEALTALYDSRFGSAEPEAEFNASHILVETEEEALAVIARLDDGADFATTAQEVSTGPSGPSGGELGWFGMGMMVAEFEAAVAELEVGAISAPVQTQFGWHVIKLNETRDTPIPELDAVRQELVSEIQEQAVTEALESLTESAEIVRAEDLGLDPAILQNLDLLEN
ncbi:MAG: peptidylprolyl isomerase [Marivivens sp.]|nr:peptidylprolyl isomerase [Marivivens sp.]